MIYDTCSYPWEDQAEDPLAIAREEGIEGIVEDIESFKLLPWAWFSSIGPVLLLIGILYYYSYMVLKRCCWPQLSPLHSVHWVPPSAFLLWGEWESESSIDNSLVQDKIGELYHDWGDAPRHVSFGEYSMPVPRTPLWALWPRPLDGIQYDFQLSDIAREPAVAAWMRWTYPSVVGFVIVS